MASSITALDEIAAQCDRVHPDEQFLQDTARASDLSRLSALMAYSAFMTNMNLDSITLERCFLLEAELREG